MNVPGYMGVYGRLMWGEPPFKRCVKTGLNFDDLIDQAPDFPPALLVTSSGDFLALEQTRNQQRFCSIIDSDVLKKIRIIATREGLQIKDVIEAAFIKAIDIYECKHGVIEDNTKRKAIDLF